MIRENRLRRLLPVRAVAVTARKKRWYPALAALVVLGACSDEATEPMVAEAPAPTFDVVANSYESGDHVMTWDAIPDPDQVSDWTTTVCATPDVPNRAPKFGRDANWQNPHNAHEVWHSWQGSYFTATWINAWSTRFSSGGNPVAPHHNWSRYSTEVEGNGSFVIRLLADNCSWVYLDGVLVGTQGTDLSKNSYGLTLNGTHTLEFIVFDGGGDSGGKFLLETTTTPLPPLNDDLDDDGHKNDADEFPLDPTEWEDSDGDGTGDNADDFPDDPTETTDSDGDGVGDIADAYPNDPSRTTLDGDGDGVDDDADNCSAVANADQADLDGDGAGDACDGDIDGDGVANGDDAYPTDPAEWADSDGDGVGDNADAFPTDPNETTDSDGDNVGDNGDVFPSDPSEWADSDNDGTGDNADAYDNSNTGTALVVGTCNTGVANWEIGSGTFANDLIAAAKASAANHGAFVKAVSNIADGWKKAGKISGREHGKIVSCAAQSK